MILPEPTLAHRILCQDRVEDRIRAAKDTGLRNLPFHDLAQNQIWLQITALAQDLIAWTQRLALTGWARIAEPKRLRLRVFSTAGWLVRTARRPLLHSRRMQVLTLLLQLEQLWLNSGYRAT